MERRLADAAQHRASALCYRVTGLKGYDEIAPSRGVAWFSLTRGCLVITVDGPDSEAEWFPTYATGEIGWKEAAQQARSKS